MGMEICDKNKTSALFTPILFLPKKPHILNESHGLNANNRNLTFHY